MYVGEGVDKMQDAATFWDNIAGKYARSPIKDPVSYQYTLDRTRSYLSKTDHVLELGCGTGSTALLLAEGVAHITASDLSTNMIQVGANKAREQGVDNVDFVRAELFDIVLDDGPYDAVLAFSLIHLLHETPKALQRVASLLKPGGFFISKTPCEPEKGAPIKYGLMRLILPLMQLFGKAPYVNFMKIGELESHIVAAGFKIIESGSYPASPPHHYVVARKTDT
jgi:ubiquinone/menaquinone biosynthesis C-methylase UbiE